MLRDASLFNRHFRTGFNCGWSQDISSFTSADWRELIILACKIDWLNGFHHMTEDYPVIGREYVSLYATIGPNFWRQMNLGHRNSKQSSNYELLQAQANIGIPFGLCVTGTPGLPATLIGSIERFLSGVKGGERILIAPALRRNALNGLIEAIRDFHRRQYTVDIFRELLELGLELSSRTWAYQGKSYPILDGRTLEQFNKFVGKIPDLIDRQNLSERLWQLRYKFAPAL